MRGLRPWWRRVAGALAALVFGACTDSGSPSSDPSSTSAPSPVSTGAAAPGDLGDLVLSEVLFAPSGSDPAFVEMP